MLNLIRADFYRLRHSGLYALLIVVLTVGSTCILPFATKNYSKATLDASLFTSSQAVLAITILISCTMVGVYIGTSYNNRMALYDVMTGYSPFKIIMSKFCSVGLLATLSGFVPLAGFFLFSYLKNGAGVTKNVPVVFVLLFVIIMHAVFSTILYAMLMKNLVFGSLISYIRFGILDMVPMLIIQQELPDSKFVQEGYGTILSVTDQGLGLINRCDSSKFIIMTVASLFIECTIVFVLVYFSYKRKKFK